MLSFSGHEYLDLMLQIQILYHQFFVQIKVWVTLLCFLASLNTLMPRFYQKQGGSLSSGLYSTHLGVLVSLTSQAEQQSMHCSSSGRNEYLAISGCYFYDIQVFFIYIVFHFPFTNFMAILWPIPHNEPQYKLELNITTS